MSDFDDIVATATQTHQAAGRLLSLAQGTNRERRSRGREPFFYPAVVLLDSQPGVRHTAFVRDISADGMGLFHLHPFETQTVTVITRLPDEEVVRLRLQLIWYRHCGDGCYISGGSFVDH